ncbi:NAD-dependent epimerase/dehydratase family protein [Microbacterium radiodurans]|uniref:NAD-dependent epimerase/dehydratase family protein n=2 Tax=Microbacterium radiodurans TaxID=661398 RepID=A0A5J5IP30_9MICO|nr:NAD-dependent epimerase/dehydratase family protein [Microbacterium radiodurans]
MKVLITGAAGFVGSRIARRALAEGHQVVGVDALTDYYDPEIKRRNVKLLTGSNFEFVAGDLLDQDLKSLLDGVNVIFHQAGQPGVRSSWGRDFEIYLRANIAATQQLLEAAVGSQSLRAMVYASSSSVYGDAENYPTLESDRPMPVSPYGVSKLAAEHLCTLYARNFGVPTVSLRYFTVYGPGQRPDMAFTRFCKAAVTGSPITLYGDGEQIRDFTFVDDIVEANFAAGFGQVEPGSVFNVAGGSNVSVNEVIRTLEELSDESIQIDRRDAVSGDVRRTSGSTAAIQSALGWSPKVSLKEGLAAQFEWARESFGTAT